MAGTVWKITAIIDFAEFQEQAGILARLFFDTEEKPITTGLRIISKSVIICVHLWQCKHSGGLELWLKGETHFAIFHWRQVR